MNFFRYKKNVPWLKIIISPAVISVIFCQFASGWGSLLLLTEMPTYLKDVHKFDVKSVNFVV
jgi:hypothetical protein